MVIVAWLVFALILGGIIESVAQEWSTRRHAHIPIVWLVFLLVLLVFSIDTTVRWSRSRRSERSSKD